MIQSVAKHNSVSPSSSVLLNALIFFMSVSMVHSNSPYKSDVTADEMRLTNSNLITDLVQYLKDASTFNERFRHSQCCPELGYYLNGQESRSASSLPSSSSPSLSALLFSGSSLMPTSSSSSASQPLGLDKRMGSEFLGKRVGSEFLGKRVGSEFLGKRMGSEFLGRRKRSV
ncbi:uncharacterized protein LOC107367396 isoform X1 [Tetranychus urticae]|uniref:uncharacterized protein LOC107367396 isoform X1 n=1 Tax=Tetranychus urticae TaxID=32264 RepID=UPI00077B9C6A|nr:uncharacterized protein LOC107367396 isoform X1 [Tetranychus urticae]